MKCRIECDCKYCPNLIRDTPTAIKSPNFVGMCTTYQKKESNGQLIFEMTQQHTFWKGGELIYRYREPEDVPPECEGQIIPIKELNNIWDKVLLRDFY